MPMLQGRRSRKEVKIKSGVQAKALEAATNDLDNQRNHKSWTEWRLT